MQVRKANLADIAEIETMIVRAVMELMGQEYSLEQRRASIGPLFGVDRQIIEDGTYYVVEHAGRLVGSGGWSFRRTLFGGDAVANRDDSRVIPGVDPAHIRAFYVDPSASRTGIGTRLLFQSEADALAQGFSRYEMMATLTGRPFYVRHGYHAGTQFLFSLPGGLRFPLVHMEKAAADTVPAGQGNASGIRTVILCRLRTGSQCRRPTQRRPADPVIGSSGRRYGPPVV